MWGNYLKSMVRVGVYDGSDQVGKERLKEIYTYSTIV